MNLWMYVLVGLSVFVVNLLPALGPPTWAVLVLWFLNGRYQVVPMVLVGAFAAGAGRLVLATAVRRLGNRLPARYRDNLEAAGQVLLRNRSRTVAGLVLFAISPVPSAQLFEAAGLTRVALRPLTTAFFAGRLASYALYLGSAQAVGSTDTGKLLLSSLTSPGGILLQVAMLGALVGLARVDWAKRSALAPADPAPSQDVA